MQQHAWRAVMPALLLVRLGIVAIRGDGNAVAAVVVGSAPAAKEEVVEVEE